MLIAVHHTFVLPVLLSMFGLCMLPNRYACLCFAQCMTEDCCVVRRCVWCLRVHKHDVTRALCIAWPLVLCSSITFKKLISGVS
jgi:hypothetical protein